MSQVSRVAERYSNWFQTKTPKSPGMYGFKTKRRPGVVPELLARIQFCPEGGGSFKVWTTSRGKRITWIVKLESALKPITLPLMKAVGMPLSDEDDCIDIAEIGEFRAFGSYTIDQFIALRAINGKIAEILSKVISRLCPVMPGMGGLGWSRASSTDWTYHWDSFSIGD